MFKRQMKKLLMGAFALVPLVFVSGADLAPDRTLYVSTTGSDDNDGLTEKTSLKSIGKAAQIVEPGDLVIVKGGKYREQITLKKSGTEKKPIVFRAAQNETVVATWGWDIAGWKKVDGTRFCYESSFPYAINMLWERKNLSRYLRLESMDLLDKQPGGFVFDKKTGKIYLHAFDGGNPEFAGITAVPYTDASAFLNGKNPVPYNNETSGSYRWNKGFLIKGSYNTVEGFELAFFPIGAQIREEAKGCTLRNNTVYGTTTGLATYCTVGGHLFENNRAYKNCGPGIIIGGKNKDMIIRNNYLLNNGHCPPFLEQRKGSGGHPYNLAQYGPDVFNVSFIDNIVISDDPSRRYGVMRCKYGIDGNMDVSGNVFIGGGPYFYPKPDSKALIKNNTVVKGEIKYARNTRGGREYKPELIANLCLKNNKVNPCFADPTFYDYRLRKDSPFIGKGAHPEAGQIFYVNAFVKEESDGSTPKKALKSLSGALKKALPGDCVYILPGTYKENISLNKIGGEKILHIRNYGKGKVVFESSLFDFKECRNLSVDGIIFKNSKAKLQDSNGMVFVHCVFDGAESGIKSMNCGLVKIINNTFVGNSLSADIVNTPAILRNNLFMNSDSLPVKSETAKTISEKNVFAGKNAEKILTEWKSKYNEIFLSFVSDIKLENNYALPNDAKLAFSGLGWTFIGARGAEKKNRAIRVENLKASRIFSDRVALQWETPFDYPKVRIICKDKNKKIVYRIYVRQGLYKQTVKSEYIKGLKPNSQYDISFIFTNPGGVDKVEKKLTVTTTKKKDFQPKTIYVSKLGDDAKSGISANEAKKSIQGAQRITLPGDTILVAPGIYTEQIEILVNGLSKDRPFVLKSEKPGQAAISANYLFNTALLINKGKYITIDGFKFTGLRYSAIATAVTALKSEGIIIKNCIFDRNWTVQSNCGCNQLKCEDVNDIEVSNCIFDNGFQGIWMQNCDNVRIFNNTFWHIGINGIHVGCTKDYNVDIYNNIFENVIGKHNSPAVSAGEHGDNIICDYNIYWKTDAECPKQKFYGTGGKEYSATWHVQEKDAPKTLEATRKMYGVEKHGQFADPLLKNPQKGDFGVKPGSPAIGKGKNDSNIGVDMSVFSK